MSKDTKDIKDSFHSELEKASLKDLQEAKTWRLGDIQKSTETIVESGWKLQQHRLSQRCSKKCGL